MHESPLPSSTDEDQLRKLLDELIVRHEQLLEVMEQKRAAMRTADASGIASAIQREVDLLSDFDEFEDRRRELTARLARRLGLTGGNNVTVSAVAERLEDDDRDGLLEQRTRLRALMERVREEGAILRSAAESLHAHVAGLIQRIQLTMNRAATYGRDGRVGAAGVTRTCIDVRE